jgi:arylsulfatase A-like enzyme
MTPFPVAAAADTAAPNVLFFFTDDQQHDTIGALGNASVHTPHTDRLVERGTAFVNAYIMGGSSPGVCLPARASLLTGRSLWNIENQGIWRYEISEANKTLPEVFRANGYLTFATGKNDPGRSGQFARAYSHADKLLFQGMTRSQYRLPLHTFADDGDYRSQQPVLHEGTHSAEVYADACIRFLEQQADNPRPFYAYVAFQTPHDPRQSPEKYRAMYPDEDVILPESFMPEHPFDNGMLRIRDENLAGFPRSEEELRRHVADYHAMISHTDAQIGRILAALERTGRMHNTIIVFASDNGLALGRHGLMGKQNIYEHSVRVPLIIKGPGIPRGEVRHQLCYLFDLYPTLCDLAGLEFPETVEFKSLVPALRDAGAAHRTHLYAAFMSWQRAVRDEQFKLIEYVVDGGRSTQLFDLQKDPWELDNLAGDPEFGEILVRLRGILRQERLRLNDGNVPYEFANEQGQAFWEIYESTDETVFP